ncbi:hypothetical protein M4R22_12450 [Acidovorax sp. GBBC 3334]|uniref:hypothetical protein n=1 Tax=Acidovorax sp. GBBC 3334 TaxID=2940496 RepID=UPI0023049576|nr:hypothetical protein [Acidovorax sp. GBBC 3334]MDA8455575.1 hypothetical protein [Acidovorax sp. GBBC 3334]
MKRATAVVALAGALCLPCMADEMSQADIIKTLESNDLASLVPMVQKGILVLNASGTTVNKMQLQRSGFVPHDEDAAAARYWYRGMLIPEVNALVASSYGTLEWNVPSFVGISPRYAYSYGYLSIKNPGAVVEFGTDASGWLFKQWSQDNTCQIKAEGGGTYGLGLAGTFASCNARKFPAGTRALGEVFSHWMASNEVTTRIVWVLVPRK